MAKKAEPVSAEEMLARLKALANPRNVEGMARFGINPEGTLGVSVADLRRLARGQRDHDLALGLWASGIHEARILAALIDDPALLTEDQMDAWVEDFDSWDVCDQVCLNLFDKTPFAAAKAVEWAARPEEFVKRAGFALMASLAWHDRQAPDALFLAFLPVIQREATDPRNYVRKAVNWALRQIGKRNPALRATAVAAAEEILQIDAQSARWIARDALRELNNYSF
jgi:3-methyladenine DNA glycosylase AlkD